MPPIVRLVASSSEGHGMNHPPSKHTLPVPHDPLSCGSDTKFVVPQPSSGRCCCDVFEASYFFSFFFFPARLLSSPLFFLSLSLLVVAQIRGHIAVPSPPSPLRIVPCILIARRIQPFLLFNVASTCAYPR